MIRRLLRTVRMARVARQFASLGRGCSLSRRAVLIGMSKISVGDSCIITDGVVLNGLSFQPLGITLGKSVVLREYAWLSANNGVIEIGDRVFIGAFVMIYGISKCRIGNDVLIGAHTSIVAGNHIFNDPSVPISQQGTDSQGICIEDDVWIGANCVVLDGVTVGRGAVVGAGSVVTKNVPPMAVVCGNPAKVMRTRTSISVHPKKAGIHA